MEGVGEHRRHALRMEEEGGGGEETGGEETQRDGGKGARPVERSGS